MRYFICLAMAFLGLTGCDPINTQSDDPAQITDLGEGGQLDPTDATQPPQSASIKRISIDMLADSMETVAGTGADGKPIEWRFKYFGKEYAAIEILGETLGKPDYAELTQENLEPSALYVKFMHDMASDVCAQMVSADEKRGPQSNERVLTLYADLSEDSDPKSTYANLRYLKLRFHSERIDDSDEASVADLKAVYDTAALEANASPAWSGWNAVCVALFTAPSFHLY